MHIGKTELFKNISDKDRKKIEKCLHLHIMEYKKGETVCSYGDGSDRIGIVLSGRAAILRTDYSGHESLLEYLPDGAVFSELMSYASSVGDSIMVRSMTKSSIAYLDYDRLITCPNGCKAPCTEHTKLRQNLISLLINRSRLLSERVQVLGCHGIREKLMCFFRLQLGGKGTGKFEMPMTWVELSLYINADRSAMTRELGEMKKDGLIDTNGSTVRVLKAR